MWCSSLNGPWRFLSKLVQTGWCMFSTCPSRQINDINEVSIRPTMGGDRGVHAESHMTETLIRENETHLRGPRGARKCHSKLAAGPVCCYFISPTALGKIKREVATSPCPNGRPKEDSPKFAFSNSPQSLRSNLSLSLSLTLFFSLSLTRLRALTPFLSSFFPPPKSFSWYRQLQYRNAPGTKSGNPLEDIYLSKHLPTE